MVVMTVEMLVENWVDLAVVMMVEMLVENSEQWKAKKWETSLVESSVDLLGDLLVQILVVTMDDSMVETLDKKLVH